MHGRESIFFTGSYVMLEIAKQSNEYGPNTMKEGMKRSKCFVCKQPIEIGQQYFHIPASLYNQRRHTICARQPYKSRT